MATKKLSDLPAAAPILGTETVFGLQSGFSVQIPYGSFKDITTTGQLTVSGANNTATGGGQIYLNGATGNRIDFASAGLAPPAFTTRSLGTKIVLWPSITAAAVDYAMGIDGNTLWTSVPLTTSVFKWYGGATLAASLLGTGDLNIAGSMGVGGATATASTSGTGITFPATQAASSNANTLDDYEEGVWTPVLTSGFTTTGAVTMSGTYTKIGRVVTVGWIVQATTVSPANAAVMSGLPFTNISRAIGSAGNSVGTSNTMPITATTSAATLIFGGTSISTPNLIGSITYIV